ncbi:glycosyltransferase family 4 protein [Leucothrix pacifica]|nr:glycosyltransferase family 1 protein [Leucothrix pacifica]
MSQANYSNQIRLAVVTETWPPEVNGVANTIQHLVNGLLRLGRYYIELVRPKQSASDQPLLQEDFEEYLTNAITLPFYKEVKAGSPHFFGLRKRWKQQRPDIIQIVTEGPLGYSAMRAAKSLGIPVFSDFHTNFDQYSQHYHLTYGWRLVNRYLRHLHNSTLCTLVPTTELAQQLQRSGYKNLEILERGINAGLFHPHKRSQQLRHSLGIMDGQLMVTLVSRMAHEKNLDLAFAAYREIQQQVPNARFVLIGDGPDRARLQAQHPDCLFVGMQTGEALAQHYASGDLFLYPSTSETFGNVIIEAMASGLPVVTYDYAAAHKYIQSGKNGITVELHNEGAFIDAAVSLATQSQQRHAMGIKARATTQQLSWDNVVLHLDHITQQLLAKVHHEETAPA